MQPSGNFVDFIIFDYRDDNRQPKGDKDDKTHDKGLHIEEKDTPRKIEYKTDCVEEKCIVLLGGIAEKYDTCANAHQYI